MPLFVTPVVHTVDNSRNTNVSTCKGPKKSNNNDDQKNKERSFPPGAPRTTPTYPSGRTSAHVSPGRSPLQEQVGVECVP